MRGCVGEHLLPSTVPKAVLTHAMSLAGVLQLESGPAHFVWLVKVPPLLAPPGYRNPFLLQTLLEQLLESQMAQMSSGSFCSDEQTEAVEGEGTCHRAPQVEAQFHREPRAIPVQFQMWPSLKRLPQRSCVSEAIPCASPVLRAVEEERQAQIDEPWFFPWKYMGLNSR